MDQCEAVTIVPCFDMFNHFFRQMMGVDEKFRDTNVTQLSNDSI